MCITSRRNNHSDQANLRTCSLSYCRLFEDMLVVCGCSMSVGGAMPLVDAASALLLSEFLLDHAECALQRLLCCSTFCQTSRQRQ
jgi:hypothetical protein